MEITSLEEQVADLIQVCGDDPQRAGMRQTPKRFLQAMRSLTQGYSQNLAAIVNGAVFDSDNDEMVVVKDIELYSLCEHHLLPFIGKCHIGYIPKGHVLGLSKFARIVDMFSLRFQIQENLTVQIADAILAATQAKSVAVVIEAQHMCMMMRGVKKQHSQMTTSCMRGSFKDSVHTRLEFLNFIKTS